MISGIGIRNSCCLFILDILKKWCSFFLSQIRRFWSCLAFRVQLLLMRFWFSRVYKFNCTNVIVVRNSVEKCCLFFIEFSRFSGCLFRADRNEEMTFEHGRRNCERNHTLRKHALFWNSSCCFLFLENSILDEIEFERLEIIDNNQVGLNSSWQLNYYGKGASRLDYFRFGSNVRVWNLEFFSLPLSILTVHSCPLFSCQPLLTFVKWVFLPLNIPTHFLPALPIFFHIWRRFFVCFFQVDWKIH